MLSNYPPLNTPEAQHRWAMFVEGNPYRGEDGRTYTDIDEDGNYISTFVSQYSDIIRENLEPGVKEAVLKLHEKGYLTFTSCQGHEGENDRYIGVLFNTKEQKQEFIKNINALKCNIHWYDNVINSLERPCKEFPKYAEGAITIHVVWDDQSYHDTTRIERRKRPYTDLELTKFWNVLTCRNYSNYEAIVFSFGYRMVERNFLEFAWKHFFYNKNKVLDAYSDFCSKVDTLPEYLA
jgi:hypothetical protein|tara:strand:+ start:669 stop:1376 length:708 start_codon:yes stop_codon:yes gene_type:complete